MLLDLEKITRVKPRRRVRWSRSDESLNVSTRAMPQRIPAASIVAAAASPQQHKSLKKQEQTPRGVKGRRAAQQQLSTAEEKRTIMEKAIVHLPDVCIPISQTDLKGPKSADIRPVADVSSYMSRAY